MAKKGARILVGLICESCGKMNYVTQRNKLNTPTSLKLKKYCPRCHKHVQHKETKKLG